MSNKYCPLLFITLLNIGLFAGCLSGQKHSSAQNNEEGGQVIFQADPTIFYHDGIYYLYGTDGKDVNQGFLVYTSSDLKNWEGPVGVKEGYALRKEDVYGDKGFWAPQVFVFENKFHMAYTANENIAVAQSDSPLGPFTQEQQKSLAAPVKQIDPFVFMDEDGKKYLYHVRLTGGNRIFVAEMTDDFSAIKPETLQECINASEKWENTANAGWPVAEGPSILKRKKLYYLIYSANDFRNIDYAVGYAVSSSPLGPFEKFKGNPILTRNDIGVNGTGHGDFIEDAAGDLFYVFHTHHSDSMVSPRKVGLIEAKFVSDDSTKNDKLVMDKESFFFLRI